MSPNSSASIAITTLAPGGRDQTRVGGVAEDRPCYRVTGDAEQVRLGFRDQRGTRRVVATSLPVSIPAPTEAASIEVTSFDGSAVRCQIRAGGAIQSDAAGDGTVVCTSR